ncbi:MAG: tetratricopeptide repeat protein [Bacteroidota bacterium]|nr:tetratricopeptide repeat protein [Bacteroidota bacterium]MDP3144156.1 tetratricopeptide repeat protein [Bacteroidota bacterium]
MQVDKNNMDDLDYISELGFEKVVTTNNDLLDLSSKIKKRIFSYNNGFYFGFISLIVGVFIGVSVFYMVDNQPKIYSSDFPNKILNEKPPVKQNTQIYLELDTVNISKENFVKPETHFKKIQDTTNQLANIKHIDTAIIIPSKPLDLSLLLENNIPESKIKYISNSSVVYIHDLKVTNYTTLYFKKNQFVKLPVKGGLPVSYANKDDLNRSRTGLKQSADYFLHEEFSDALLAFKNKNYNQSIYALNVISGYNDEDVNCNFYLGMCYYYKKNYSKANEFFDRCIQSSNNTFLQEATYYRALSLYESGDKVSAIQKFKFIAEEGEFYSEKAKAFLKN